MQHFATKLEALRALRKIVTNNDELILAAYGGGWTFEESAAIYAAELEPEHDQRERYASLPTPKPKGPAMQDEELQTADYQPGDVHNTSHKLMETTETVSLGEVVVEEVAVVDAHESLDDAEPALVEQSERHFRRTRSVDERAESSARKAADRAQRDADAELRRAERDARRDIRRAERQTRLQQAQESHASRRAARDARRAARLLEDDAKQAVRDARAEAREMDSRNGVLKPGEDSKVGRLWATLDTMREWPEYKNSQWDKFPTFQEFKAEIADHLYEMKGNDLTQSTAYYKYRIYHGITGRIVESKSA